MGGTHSAFVKEIKKPEPSSDKLLKLIDTLRDEKKINLNTWNRLPPVALVCWYLEGDNLILALEKLLQYGADIEVMSRYVTERAIKCGDHPFIVLCKKKPLQYIEAIQLIMTYRPGYNDLSGFKFVDLLGYKFVKLFEGIDYLTGNVNEIYDWSGEDYLSLDLIKLLVSKNIDLTPIEKEYDSRTLGSLSPVSSIESTSPLAQSELVNILFNSFT